MKDFLERWLFDPTVGKIIAAIVGIVVIRAFVGLFQRSLNHYISDSIVRYRVRKLDTFIGYLAVILFITTVFSDRLGGLAVAFGVAGAGVAFALQEVIASVAGGWLYRSADFTAPETGYSWEGLREM